MKINLVDVDKETLPKSLLRVIELLEFAHLYDLGNRFIHTTGIVVEYDEAVLGNPFLNIQFIARFERHTKVNIVRVSNLDLLMDYPKKAPTLPDLLVKYSTGNLTFLTALLST